MALIDNDQVIQAVPSDRSDQALHVGVLPRRPRCRWSIPDPHGVQPVLEDLAKGPITVSNEMARRPAPEGCHDMLRYFWLGLDKQINGELAGDKSNRRVDLRALLTPSATETSLKVGREDDEPPSFACESLESLPHQTHYDWDGTKITRAVRPCATRRLISRGPVAAEMEKRCPAWKGRIRKTRDTRCEACRRVGVGVELHGEDRPVLHPQAFEGPVEQRSVGLRRDFCFFSFARK